jgi:hypothetical protein
MRMLGCGRPGLKNQSEESAIGRTKVGNLLPKGVASWPRPGIILDSHLRPEQASCRTPNQPRSGSVRTPSAAPSTAGASDASRPRSRPSCPPCRPRTSRPPRPSTARSRPCSIGSLAPARSIATPRLVARADSPEGCGNSRLRPEPRARDRSAVRIGADQIGMTVGRSMAMVAGGCTPNLLGHDDADRVVVSARRGCPLTVMPGLREIGS